MSTWLHLLVSEQEAENCSSETFDETGFDCTCQFTDEEGCCYYSWKIYECYGFGKSNTLTSYTDHGGCGFWGNDAQANLSQCDHGYYKAHFKPIDDWKYVAFILMDVVTTNTQYMNAKLDLQPKQQTQQIQHHNLKI